MRRLEKLRMANVSGEILINRPVEQVFDWSLTNAMSRATTHECSSRRRSPRGRSGSALDPARPQCPGGDRRDVHRSDQYQRARRFGSAP